MTAVQTLPNVLNGTVRVPVKKMAVTNPYFGYGAQPKNLTAFN